MLYQFDPMNLEQETVILLTKQLRHLRGYNAVTQREIATLFASTAPPMRITSLAKRSPRY